MKTLAVLCCLVAVAVAMYPPRAPLAGTYEFEVAYSGDKKANYVGGRVVYDFVSGYYRMDTWPTRELNPGIDGVSIWDFRELPPVVTTIDDTMTCYTQKMDPKLSPKPEDYSKYLFSGFKFWNRALAEEWTDGGGGMLYTDVFSRDIVGFGNISTGYMYNILKWSDKPPSGTNFLIPNTMPCTAPNVSAVPRIETRAVQFDLSCEICQKGIGLIKGGICSHAGAAACAPFPPAIPYCGVLASVLCNSYDTSELKACQIINLC